jgi:hypothetical protein
VLWENHGLLEGGGENNPVHLDLIPFANCLFPFTLLTVRPFKEDGTWGEKKRRVYERDEHGEIKRTEDGKKIFQTVSSADWNHRETLVKWRLAYAEAINDSFLENGINQKVSALHKSLMLP